MRFASIVVEFFFAKLTGLEWYFSGALGLSAPFVLVR
jgi:hypothetical protein